MTPGVAPIDRPTVAAAALRTKEEHFGARANLGLPAGHVWAEGGGGGGGVGEEDLLHFVSAFLPSFLPSLLLRYFHFNKIHLSSHTTRRDRREGRGTSKLPACLSRSLARSLLAAGSSRRRRRRRRKHENALAISPKGRKTKRNIKGGGGGRE